jgi:hypothetical protein
MVICSRSGGSEAYLLKIVHLTSDVAVIWLEGTASKQRWYASECQACVSTWELKMWCRYRFCNVPFESFCRFSTSGALDAMPQSVLGMLQVSQSIRGPYLRGHDLSISQLSFLDMQDADDDRSALSKAGYPVRCAVVHCSAYCITIQLKIKLWMAKGSFDAEFNFPMLPDTPATVRDREDLSPLAVFPDEEEEEEEEEKEEEEEAAAA